MSEFAFHQYHNIPSKLCYVCIKLGYEFHCVIDFSVFTIIQLIGLIHINNITCDITKQVTSFPTYYYVLLMLSWSPKHFSCIAIVQARVIVQDLYRQYKILCTANSRSTPLFPLSLVLHIRLMPPSK